MPRFPTLGRVVFKKLEDVDLAANLQFTWQPNNDSALLKELTASTHLATKLRLASHWIGCRAAQGPNLGLFSTS